MGSGNKGMRRDSNWMIFEHDYISTKIRHAKVNDETFHSFNGASYPVWTKCSFGWYLRLL